MLWRKPDTAGAKRQETFRLLARGLTTHKWISLLVTILATEASVCTLNLVLLQ